MKELYATDVLVVGGGPAGIGAAIGAARKGAKTMLIENQGFFGGVGAFCLGMSINQMRPFSLPRSAVHELVIEKIAAFGDLAVKIGEHQLTCNVEYLKVGLLDALDAAGVKYLVHTPAVDAVVENGRITGVIVSTKQGLGVIRARAVVDCTGDADVAFFAGAETMKEVGDLSPSTLCLNVTNIDMSKLNLPRQAARERMAAISAKAREKYPLFPKVWGMGRFPVTNSIYINHAGTRAFGETRLDASDPEDLTVEECMSRRQAIQMISALREFGGEGFADAQLVATGPQIGVRETRRVKGGYILTEEDALTGAKFDDVIAWRSGFLDIGFVRFGAMKVHQVPYRAIVPEKLDGLLMAGRCISATHVGASAGKSMGNCMATGHAAGLASAMAVAKGCTARELKVSDIQDKLRADGVDLTRGGEDQIPDHTA